ncbi:hypothetical protein B4113_1658 [Geobacillus sp. B4113_201601]|nr:hypothetical protein B4113_1658 [Geobacillus sp. B4113_201601]
MIDEFLDHDPLPNSLFKRLGVGVLHVQHAYLTRMFLKRLQHPVGEPFLVTGE